MTPTNPSPLSLKEKGTEPDKATLDARVRSLRIAKSDRSNGSGRTTALPWIFVLLLTLLCGWLMIRDRQLMSRLGFQAKEETEVESPPTTAVSNASSNQRTNETKETPKVPQSQSLGTDGATSKGNASNSIALEARGYVVAKHQVLISPQVSGRILSLNIEEGRRVAKGDILAQVEQTEYRADLEQMKGILQRNKAELSELETGARPQEIAGATADLQEQLEVLSQLESQYNRAKSLKLNSISPSEFEQTQSSYQSMKKRTEKLRQSLDMMKEGPRKERIEMARAAVTQAEANLAKSQWRLDNCTIRSPISGIILKKNAEEGNLVNSVAFSGSTSICDIADLSDLEIDLNIQERDVSKVTVNQPCEVRLEAFPKRVYKAKVARLMPIADRAKGAVPVRVSVKVPEDEEGVYLKPEMSAVVVFFADNASN